jgi:uncharacterized membrane protein (DUF106 family)
VAGPSNILGSLWPPLAIRPWKCTNGFTLIFLPFQKEAVYTAVGLASYDLFDEVDFDSWFSSYLLTELKVVAIIRQTLNG